MTILEAHCNACGSHQTYRVGENVYANCMRCGARRAIAMRRLSWFERVRAWFGGDR